MQNGIDTLVAGKFQMRQGTVIWRPIIFGAALLALGVLGGAAWAEGLQADPNATVVVSPAWVDFSPPFLSADGLGRPDGHLLGSSVLFSLGQAFIVESSYVEKHDDSKGLKGPSGHGEGQGPVNFISTSSFDGKLTGEGELAYAPFNPETIGGFGKDRYRLLWFGLKASWSKIGFGSEYRPIGNGFTNLTDSKVKSDQEGPEIWLERRLGPTHMKVSLSKSWNNLKNDPRRPRNTKILGRVALDVHFPSFPLMSLSYSQGLSKGSSEPDGPLTQEYQLETVSASLYHGTSSWDATFSTSYSLTTDRLNPGRDTLLLSHTLSSSIRLISTISIFPTVSLIEERYRWSQVQTPSASVSLVYSPFGNLLSFNGFGYYARTSTSDKFVHYTTTNVTAGPVWTLRGSTQAKKTISLHVAYDRYLDLIYPDSSLEELSGWLSLKVTSF